MKHNHFGLPPHAEHVIEPDPAAADRADRNLAVFALGVILGWLLKTTGAA